MISFIIPCFNSSALLNNCLESFLWQDKNIPFEIILVDNNSTEDNLYHLYRKFRDRLPLYQIHQPLLKSTFSLCRARNLGLKIAKYKWAATIDSDIILNPNYLSSLAKILMSSDNIIATGERKFISHNDVNDITVSKLLSAKLIPSSSNYNMVDDRRLPYLEDLNNCEHPWACFHGCNTIFNRQDAIDIGGFDESYDGEWGYEDLEFAFRLISKRRCKTLFDKDLLVYHQEEVEKIVDRSDKSENSNWHRVCKDVAGIKEFKLDQYKELIDEKVIRLDY